MKYRFLHNVLTHSNIYRYNSRCLDATHCIGNAILQPLASRTLLDPYVTKSRDSDIENVGNWEQTRAVGLPLWIDRPALLWKAATQLARCEFLIGQKQRDPWRAAPFYVAMKKTRVLSTPFQRFGQKRIADFFQRDFTIKSNRDAALKNAYKLLST